MFLVPHVLHHVCNVRVIFNVVNDFSLDGSLSFTCLFQQRTFKHNMCNEHNCNLFIYLLCFESIDAIFFEICFFTLDGHCLYFECKPVARKTVIPPNSQQTPNETNFGKNNIAICFQKKICQLVIFPRRF